MRKLDLEGVPRLLSIMNDTGKFHVSPSLKIVSTPLGPNNVFLLSESV